MHLLPPALPHGSFSSRRAAVCTLCAFAALFGMGLVSAQAQETLRVSVGQRGTWDASVSEIGQRAGIFRKHGLALDIVYTSGAAETLRALIADRTDIAAAAGMPNVLAAFAKGAPLRVIGATMTGVSDLFWYVEASSPVRSLKEAGGRSVAYSADGATTQRVLAALLARAGAKAKPVATGGPGGTLTQVMAGDVEIGWSAPPAGLDRIERKELRVVASGSDAAEFRTRTVRVLAVNAALLKQRMPALDRYIRAYRESVEFMYGDGGLEIYADWTGLPLETARRMRDGYYPKQALDPGSVQGLDASLRDLVALKVLSGPLSREQAASLVQIPRP